MSNPALFTSMTIRDVTIRNRIWVAPMCQYSSEAEDGVATDWHLVHLGSFAQGGAGLIVTEATAVNAAARISPQDLGIWNDVQVASFRRITAFLRSQGAVSAIQLAHAGRKASTYRPWAPDRGTVQPDVGGWTTVAPSPIPFPGYDTPDELDQQGIDTVVADFAAAGRRAVDAGFDVLEVHAAHGYLVHQFLSPLSNERTDSYGGSLENRARLLLEIVRALRSTIGDRVPLLVRFSGTDWVEGGWDESQTATVARWAREAGADVFDISSGGNVSGVTIPVSPGYQVPLADFVGKAADVPVVAVGLITTARQAADIIDAGLADAVMLGREMLRDPHFALRAAHELGARIDYWPVQYIRAPWPSAGN